MTNGSTKKVSFFIDLVDVPRTTAQQKRVRVVKGVPMFYDSPEMKQVRGMFHQEFFRRKPKEPFTGVVNLKVVYCFKASKTNKAGTYKITRPDNDNLVKALKDSLADVGFYKDDAIVAIDNITKCWSDRPGIFIGVKEMPREYNLEEDIRKWEEE